MPKKVKKGIGMMEHTRIQYDLTAAGGEAEWQASIDHMINSCVGFDEQRDQIAAGFRAILQKSGVSDPSSLMALHETYNQYSEDAIEYLIAKWLIEYHHLDSERATASISPDPIKLEYLVERAVELGKLQERLFWRQGIDVQTGKRPEALALAGRAQVKSGQNGNRMRTDNSFAITRGAEAQIEANKLHKSNPSLSWTAIRNILATRYDVSAETLKKALKNPRKVG